jgi:predicted dehydrogenase
MSIQNNINTLRFAIIGCGRIAERHASIMQQFGKIIAVCDIQKSKAEDLAAKYNSNAYQNASEMFQAEPEIQMVAICSPNGLHADHTLLSMENGADVICEKPMALKLSDCHTMKSASEKSGRKIFVVKQNRYNPPIVQLKKWLDDGYLGRILSVQVNAFWNRDPAYYHNSWKGTQDLDGGTLFTQFSHFVDIMYWLFGDMQVEHAMLDNLNHKGIIDFEDTGSVNVRFATGALGNINYNVNSHQKNMEGSVTVFAEKGTVKIGGQYLNELEYHSIDGIEKIHLPSGNKANEYGSYTGSMSNHELVYQNVIDVLQGQSEMTTSLSDAMKTVEIIEEIYKIGKNKS